MIKNLICKIFGHKKKFVHREKSEVKVNAAVDCYRCHRCGELVILEVVYDEERA